MSSESEVELYAKNLLSYRTKCYNLLNDQFAKFVKEFYDKNKKNCIQNLVCTFDNIPTSLCLEFSKLKEKDGWIFIRSGSNDTYIFEPPFEQQKEILMNYLYRSFNELIQEEPNKSFTLYTPYYDKKLESVVDEFIEIKKSNGWQVSGTKINIVFTVPEEILKKYSL